MRSESMRGGRLGSRVDEGRSKARKVLRIARFCESMTIRMHRRPPVSLGRPEDASATSSARLRSPPRWSRSSWTRQTRGDGPARALERFAWLKLPSAALELDDVVGEETRRT